jgi:hypothetical protein
LARDVVSDESLAWVELLDLDSMIIQDGVHKEMAEPTRFSDLVISFKCKRPVAGGCAGLPEPLPEGFSIYLLIEFQSSSEPMCLRLLEYLARVYRRQHGKKSTKPLSPVVPIVIYNGEERWREDPSFIHRFPHLPESLKPYIPNFRYFLIDESSFDREQLQRLSGAMAAFIKIDTIAHPERSEEVAREIITVLSEMMKNQPEAGDLLISYIEGLVAHKGIENPTVREYINKRRSPMLAQRLDRALKKQWDEGKSIGLEQGIEKGLDKGTVQGKQQALLHLFDRKFGATEEDRKILSSCEDSQRLDRALDVILFAAEKESVLDALR